MQVFLDYLAFSSELNKIAFQVTSNVEILAIYDVLSHLG